jgi:predicted RNase H-like nuclease (RuvC/YqgF family)
MHIIVGVDTGKTVAVSCLSLDGNLVYSAHMKSGGESWIVSAIRNIGIPSVIASDKNTKGEKIRKINSAFNAVLFMPKDNIMLGEKRELAHAQSIKDPHERDAYVAAIKAYNYYANKLKQAKRKAEEKYADDIDEVLAKVIKKYSISEAIENKNPKRLSNKNVWG